MKIVSNSFLTGLTIVVDVLLGVALYVAFLAHRGALAMSEAGVSICVVALVYLFVVANGGVLLYKRDTHPWNILGLTLKNTVKYAVLTTLILYLTRFKLMPVAVLAWYFIAVFGASTLFRVCIHYTVRRLRTEDKRRTGSILVGSTGNIRELYTELTENVSLGYRVWGYFDHAPNPQMPEECPYLGTPEEVNAFLGLNIEVRSLFCCLPSKEAETILPIIYYCVNHNVSYHSVPNVSNYVHNRLHLHMLGSVPIINIYVSPLAKGWKKAAKRLFDIIFSILVLCTLFPIVWLVVAIVTKITMPGPVFFTQERSGLNGETFKCLKFRSMKVNDCADEVQATKNDPRKTKWGEIMRKTNIDELPQFINVLLGDMSVVGPRPHMLKHTKQYSELIDKYMMRHLVKPGITGWSQVTGYRGETRHLWQMEGRVKNDIWYIEHWSFGLDLYIIWRTVVNAVCGDKQAY